MIKLSAAFTIFLVFASVIHAQAELKNLTGTITAIEGDHIQVKDQSGKPTLIMLQKSTKYVKAGLAAKKQDLKVGIRVTIRARMENKMKMYAAEEVTIAVAAR